MKPITQIQKPAFRKWLAAQEPTTIVGFRGSCFMCPLARYLDARGIHDAEVQSTQFQARGDWYDLNEWQLVFIKKVDAGAKPPLRVTRIQARTAIRILDSIT